MTPETEKSTEYSQKSSSENIVSRNVHDKLTDDNKTESIITVVDDSNPEYPENTSPERIVEDFFDGKISSYKKYNELFWKAFYHRLSPSPLEKFMDSIEKKKNQIINKVIGFVKKLGIFEK